MSPRYLTSGRSTGLARRGLAGFLCVCLFLAAGNSKRAQGSEAANRAKRSGKGSGDAVDFNRDIRPILSENCFACHGPDRNKRKSGLRLDTSETVFGKLESGKVPVVPGDSGHSELVRRLVTADKDDLMPPPASGKHVTEAQTALIRRWVEQGAKWEEHWSYVVPKRPARPEVRERSWPRNDVDFFVLNRIEKAGLQPNPEADRPALIRRVSLDLTGLPPSVEEVDAFLSDKTPDAYEKVVDRLLGSRHYGERMAMNWLDLARYADTSGYHFDGVRFMWLWRDWVIKAFNENKPFDTFTVEQLAGDLLPDATVDQRIASGFNRNNMTTDEGGADPDEYLNKYAVDRVNTTSIVWLGLTVGCAECHDHKYDRATQRDFYQLYGFYNSVPEKGLDRIRTDNPPPRLPVPTAGQAAQMVERDFALRDAEKTLQDRQNELGETQEKWERETNAKPPPTPPSVEGLAGQILLDGDLAARAPGDDAAKKTTNTMVTNVVGRLLGAEQPVFTDGRSGKALQLDGKAHVDLGGSIQFERTNAFSYGAWIRPTAGSSCILSKMAPDPSYQGFDIMLSDGRVEAHIVSRWPEDALKVRSKDQLPMNQWSHVLVTYDGSAKAGGVRVYVNGKPRELEVQKDQLKGSILTSEPLRLGARGPQNSYSGLLSDVRFYQRALSEEDVRLLVFQGFVPVIAKTGGQRSKEQQEDLSRFYRENYAVDFIRSEKALAKARQAKDDLVRAIPTTMIMAEMDKPRDTHILVRGDFRTKGERVWPGVPAFLPPLSGDQPTNRLALARWLVGPNQPLTARVTVNRYWQLIFGTGLVKTLNDFGSQGEWPSHPELLEWLACQFRDGGPVVGRVGDGRRSVNSPVPAWDVKGLMRLLVTSATYRQAATVTPAKLERDGANRLLSRGPRHRLDAEFVRDNALAIAGLLNTKVGGASFKPYQPAGIWDGTDSEYVQDHGEDIYRRGMYVFWRRSAHYPSFATFDAPNREVCTFLRQRTQTPLQSLVLMNDPVFVEAARGLAQRVVREGNADLRARLGRAFRLALARTPSPEEFALMERIYRQQTVAFGERPDAAKEYLKAGESPVLEGVDPVDLAALTSVASALLNLNETISN